MGNAATILRLLDHSSVTRTAKRELGTSFFGGLGESLWNNSISGMALSDSSGSIVAVNPSFLRIMQLNESDIIGQPFWTIWGLDIDPRLLQRAYQRRFSAQKLDQLHEHRLMLPNGRILHLEVSGSFIGDETGDRLLFTKIRDLSESREMERRLRESEANYSSLFRNAVQPMFQTSADGTLLNVNQAFLNLLGYSTLEELRNLDVSREIYVNPQDRPRLLRMLQKHGAARGIEIRVRRRDGAILTVREYSRTVCDRDGAVVLYEGILEDVTEQKDMQRKLDHYIESLRTSEAAQKKLNAQKNKLMSIMSHDLRSPFTSILGFTEVLQDDYDHLSDKDRLEYIRFVHESATQQLELLNHLLDWSKFESGRYTMDQKAVDMSELVRSCVANLSGSARQKGVLLTSDMPDDLQVMGDKNLLVQAFNNLITNALKFTPSGGSIAVSHVPSDDMRHSIAVSDTGTGIPKADLGKLFKAEEKYTRAGVRGEPGTGLGLPIVAEIVEKHSGTISVSSTEGEGTTFTLGFPRPTGSAQRRVVVADDDPRNRKLHMHYIRRLMPDAEVLEARNGEETLTCARQPGVVLVLSDYMMPVVDGYEVLQTLKSSDATKHIPVVMITGDGSSACVDTLFLAGATEVLKKPVRKAQLTGVLAKILPELTPSPSVGGTG